MKIPSFKRIYKGDYSEEYQGLVDQLATSLNIGIETLYNVLTKNISLSDNTLSMIKDITVTVDSSGIPTSSVNFKLDFIGNASGLVVLKADNLTNSTIYPTGGLFISWSQSEKAIIINHIAGLPANNIFRVKVIVFG